MSGAIVVPIVVRNSTGRAHLDGIDGRTRCGEHIRDFWIITPLDAVPQTDRCARCFRTAEEKTRESNQDNYLNTLSTVSPGLSTPVYTVDSKRRKIR